MNRQIKNIHIESVHIGTMKSPDRHSSYSWICRVVCLGVMLVGFLPLSGRSQSPAVHGYQSLNGKQIQIYGIGNAVMADRPLESESRGWMQLLPMFFPLNVHFENLAENNLTLQAFVQSNGAESWQRLETKLKPGDLVLVSFLPDQGHLNESDQREDQAMQEVLKGIQAAGAKAILVNPTDSASNPPTKPSSTAFYNQLFYSLPSKEPLSNGDSIPLYKALHIANHLAEDLKADKKIHIHAIPTNVEANINTSYTAFNPHVGTDFIAKSLQREAAVYFQKYHRAAYNAKVAQTVATRTPHSKLNEWSKASKLRTKLIQQSGVQTFHRQDLDLHETGRIQQKGYTIRKIYFQIRPGIYATANLYVPDGKGPFPALINSHGHWPDGKAGEMVQACAITLAQNGYVCLNMDAWGAGERTTRLGTTEYHGSNLGASLLDIGESLLGNQVTDNMRGVDLLCSLPYVDSNRIGATGASGGGNQTMWLAALDTRIKASMPVVSVGTFQSYIMGSNCVCELMPGGLTLTEESGVLGLIAPRFLKIGSALKDASPTFAPAQMLRSLDGAKEIYRKINLCRKTKDSADMENLQYQLFNTPHGYFPETRSAMLAWFNYTLKHKKDSGFAFLSPVQLLPAEKLAVFYKGNRSPLIKTTLVHDRQIGKEQNAVLLKQAATGKVDPKEKRSALINILGLSSHAPDHIAHIQKRSKYEKRTAEQSHKHSLQMMQAQAVVKGYNWVPQVIRTYNNHLIPIQVLAPKRKNGKVLLVCLPDSSVLPEADLAGSLRYRTDYLKNNFGRLISQYAKRGDGIIIADLWGLGAAGSAKGRKVNGALPLFHTLARADIWLGRTVIGEWVSDLGVLSDFIAARFGSKETNLAAGKEVAVAALASNAIYHRFESLYLDHLPISYVVDKVKGIDYFNMALHLPGIIPWGDVRLMAALNKNTDLKFLAPVSITGKLLNARQKEDYRKELDQLDQSLHSKNRISIE